MDPDASSASCRIVVVSSSLDTSREVANRIKSLSGDTSGDHQPSEVIHWTIKNKYYTAPVHFHPIHLEGLESIELDDVPAIIYAWRENEPYKEHLKQVAEQTSSYNPEVSLAISMAPITDEQLEDFFFEHGFEYVEGYMQVQDEPAGLASSSGTPGMHRAVDALSTVMWPSMVRTETKGPKLAMQFVSSSPADEVDIDYQTLVSAADSDGRSGIQGEMEMLERWLEEEGDSYEDDACSDVPITSTSTGGFDDDFTEFIAAPDTDSDLPSTRTGDIRAASPPASSPVSDRSAPNESEIDMDSTPAFDLTRMLGALDSMKADISRIPDTRERRRAAAKAALGFVLYGLEATNADLDAAASLT